MIITFSIHLNCSLIKHDVCEILPPDEVFYIIFDVLPSQDIAGDFDFLRNVIQQAHLLSLFLNSFHRSLLLISLSPFCHVVRGGLSSQYRVAVSWLWLTWKVPFVKCRRKHGA